MHYGQGHYFCRGCGHAVYEQHGGCRTCQTPLERLIMLDVAVDMGMIAMDSVFFDPFDGDFSFFPQPVVEEVVIVDDGPFVEEVIVEDFGGGAW